MSKVLLVGGTRFHSEGIAWAVRQGLSRRERFCKVALLLSGFIFFTSLGYAKGNYFTLEAVFALVPVLVALGIRTTARLASTGDSPETYQDRLVQPGAQFEEVAQALRDDFVEVRSSHGNYHYLLNPSEIRWFSPWLYVNFKPLRVFWIFGLYALAVGGHFHLPAWPGLAELHILEYRDGLERQLLGVCLAISALGLLTVAASLKRGLKLACQGGVVERLFLYTSDRPLVVDALETRWAK